MKHFLVLIIVSLLICSCTHRVALRHIPDLWIAQHKLKRTERVNTKLIKKEPDNVNAYIERGYARYALQNNSGSISDLTKAVELDSTNARAYAIRGMTKHQMKDYKGAIDDYSKSIEIDPKNATSYCNRGWAKYYMKDLNGACSDWKKAKELGSDWGGAGFCK